MHFYLLIVLICATPAVLIIDSPIEDSIIPVIMALAFAFVARTIRPGQADHFSNLARPVAIVAAVPAVWIIVQMLPLGIEGVSNPIWDSASAAIGHPIRGSISIDPGITLLSLCRYFTMTAVLFLSLVASLDRQLAQWVLFALMTATALIALVLIGDDIARTNFLFAADSKSLGIGALDSAALGLILSFASAIGEFDRFQTQRIKGKSPITAFAIEFTFCIIAFTACTIAIFLHPSGCLILAAGSGLATLGSVVLIRRLGLGPWGRSAIGSIAIIIAFSIVATQPASRVATLTLPLVPQVSDSHASLVERILAAAPWAGTGAGTFAALIPIYRDAGEAIISRSPPNVATKIAIETGRAAVWTVLFLAIVAAVALFRGALRRGRDSFYPAAGAGCVVTIVLLSFTTVGMSQTTTSVLAAAILGLAFAQRVSRSIK